MLNPIDFNIFKSWTPLPLQIIIGITEAYFICGFKSATVNKNKRINKQNFNSFSDLIIFYNI